MNVFVWLTVVDAHDGGPLTLCVWRHKTVSVGFELADNCQSLAKHSPFAPDAILIPANDGRMHEGDAESQVELVNA